MKHLFSKSDLSKEPHLNTISNLTHSTNYFHSNNDEFLPYITQNEYLHLNSIFESMVYSWTHSRHLISIYAMNKEYISILNWMNIDLYDLLFYIGSLESMVWL